MPVTDVSVCVMFLISVINMYIYLIYTNVWTHAQVIIYKPWIIHSDDKIRFKRFAESKEVKIVVVF